MEEKIAIPAGSHGFAGIFKRGRPGRPVVEILQKEAGRMPSNRIDRISEEVMRALAELLPTVKDPRLGGGLLSVLRCEVTNDLRWCKVYLSAMGDYDQKELKKGLKSCSGYLRRQLAHSLSLRYTPELVFVLDDSIQTGAHINRLLSQLPELSQEEQNDDDENNDAVDPE
jgi:ribosome-binding factor A